MGERKVLNKYIPADFDPSLVPRGKKLSSKDGTVPVRMMLPFSVQCSTCHTFLYRGRKFNSKKEPMGGSDGKYLGITRWRFYIKCTHCSRPLTFLTDPKNADYEMESGGTRNYEIQKDKVATEEEVAIEQEKEEKEDPMKALENRVLESQSEMADLDNLEEIKAMNARHIKLLAGTKDSVLGKEDANDELDLLTAEDEALVKSIKFGKLQSTEIRRLDEEDEMRLEEHRRQETAALQERQLQLAAKAMASKRPALAVLKVKRKRVTVDGEGSNQEKAAKTVPAGGGLASLLGGYGSDSSSNSD
jgi:Saf4/Yju2 protein